MGTVISPHHLQRIEGMVSRTKGKILEGGKRMRGKSQLDGFDFSLGSFFSPTVVSDISIEDELWQEEVFGPVVVIKRFSVSNLLLRAGGILLTEAGPVRRHCPSQCEQIRAWSRNLDVRFIKSSLCGERNSSRPLLG